MHSPSLDGAASDGAKSAACAEPFADVFCLRAALTGALPSDPPLLRELGIDTSLIWAESTLCLRALRTARLPTANPTDVTGPVSIIALFTLSLVLQGKIHFGYVYLITLCSVLFMSFLLNTLAPQGVSAAACCSIMGYSFVPVLGFSMLRVAGRLLGAALCVVLAGVAVCWSTYAATVLFCQYLGLWDRSVVLGLPLFLTYGSCALLVL